MTRPSQVMTTGVRSPHEPMKRLPVCTVGFMDELSARAHRSCVRCFVFTGFLGAVRMQVGSWCRLA